MTKRIFFTSDLHAFHKNIMKFCPTTRHGEDELEMTEMLIQSWNKQVRVNDIVYNLGDVSFGSVDQTKKFLARLNGYHVLVAGNHDDMVKRIMEKTMIVDEVHESLYQKIGGHFFHMYHFPLETWRNRRHGTIHLYGHLHGDSVEGPGKRMDVGIDARPLGDMRLWELGEILDRMKDREVGNHHED